MFVLRVNGCPEYIVSFFSVYFENRYIKLYSDGIHLLRRVDRGCPQGSVCGPLVWNVSYNDIFNLKNFTLGDTEVRVRCYADDTQLLIIIIGKDIPSIKYLGDELCRAFHRYCEVNGLALNVGKSNCVLFADNRKVDTFSLGVLSTVIAMVEHTRILGIFFDRKLSFRYHCAETVRRLEAITGRFMKFAGSQFKFNGRSLRLIYKAAIVPLICYGTALYGPGYLVRYNLQALHRVQSYWTLWVIKGYRTTSTLTLCVISGVIPVELYIAQHVSRFLIRNWTLASKSQHVVELADLLLPELGVRGGHELVSDFSELGGRSPGMLSQQDGNKLFLRMVRSYDMGKNYAVLTSVSLP